MNISLNKPAAMIVVALAGSLLTAGAGAANTPLERMVQMHSGPDEYYFFEDDRKQVIDYKRERVVRICTGESEHLVPLKVTFDNRTAMIDEGDCMRVEAKSVYLEPAEPLDANWTIRAEVETLQ